VVPEAADAADDVVDLLPRADISPLLTDAILSDLSSSAWLTRKAAADAIDQILTDAGMPSSPLLTGVFWLQCDARCQAYDRAQTCRNERHHSGCLLVAT
jgi:hypothetical protein